MSDIFMSYARDDEIRVRQLAGEFERLGWSVWYDRGLQTSEEYDERIERELDAALCVVVVWSAASVKSKWVRAEAAEADNQGKLIPVTFDPDVVPPMRFRQLNVAQLSSTSLEMGDDALRLVRELSATTGKAPRGWDARLGDGTRGGGRSGAKTVTPGNWTLTTKFIFAKAKYDFQLLPSGIVTGSGAWSISRAQFSGRWHYDSSKQILQIEMSGGISEGLESIAVQVVKWENDDSALCKFQNRNAQLQRVRG